MFFWPRIQSGSYTLISFQWLCLLTSYNLEHSHTFCLFEEYSCLLDVLDMFDCFLMIRLPLNISTSCHQKVDNVGCFTFGKVKYDPLIKVLATRSLHCKGGFSPLWYMSNLGSTFRFEYCYFYLKLLYAFSMSSQTHLIF